MPSVAKVKFAVMDVELVKETELAEVITPVELTASTMGVLT